jgi:hypothetical protein
LASKPTFGQADAARQDCKLWEIADMVKVLEDWENQNGTEKKDDR